jgi:hypothetical protein
MAGLVLVCDMNVSAFLLGKKSDGDDGDDGDGDDSDGDGDVSGDKNDDE